MRREGSGRVERKIQICLQKRGEVFSSCGLKILDFRIFCSATHWCNLLSGDGLCRSRVLLPREYFDAWQDFPSIGQSADIFNPDDEVGKILFGQGQPRSLPRVPEGLVHLNGRKSVPKVDYFSLFHTAFLCCELARNYFSHHHYLDNILIRCRESEFMFTGILVTVLYLLGD